MNYESARKNLIEQHIRPWNVYNSDAINSLYKVPRENFVPLQYKKYAYLSENSKAKNEEFSIKANMICLKYNLYNCL